MSFCSFLSNSDNEVECFNDCAFYNWEETGGVCPFKNLTGTRMNKINELLQYDFFGEHGIKTKEIDEYYMENDYN